MTAADRDLVPPRVDTHTIVLLVRPLNAPQLSQEELDRLQREHLAYLRDLGRRRVLIANGPLRRQSNQRLRGLSVYALPPDEARATAEADPMVRAGRLTVEVAEWSTAEGAARFGGASWPAGAQEPYQLGFIIGASWTLGSPGALRSWGAHPPAWAPRSPRRWLARAAAS